jgi:integrase
VGDLLTEWLSFKGSSSGAKTLHEDSRKIEHDIRPALGSLPLVELTAKHLDDQYGKWLKGTGRQGGRPLSGTSVRHMHRIISAALSQAVKWGYLPANPAKLATPPASSGVKSETVPSPEVVQRLLAKAVECNDRVMAAAITLAFLTGARRGEICALRWSDIKLVADGGSIRIERSLAEVDDVVSEKTTKTGSGRTVALDARSVVLLREIRTQAEAFATAAGTKLVADPYVISQASDGAAPFEPGRLTDRFRLICGRARVRGVRFHDLRHGHATYLISAGIDPLTVAKRLGHTRTSTTLDIYSHALPAGGEAAALVIGGLLPA